MAANAKSSLKVPSISAIFFDLDNTLIKTRRGDRLACEKMTSLLCEEHGLPEATAATATQQFLADFRRCPDNRDTSLDKWRSLLWANALGCDHAALSKQVYLRWLQLRYDYLALGPDVAALLQQLRKRYLLALITNGPSAAQWEKVQRLDLSRYFDCILVSGDLPWEKPQEQIFHAACRLLGVSPSLSVMIGDKLETDIRGGQHAELGATVWIPRTSSRTLARGDPRPTYTLDSLADLPGLLGNHGNPTR